MTSVVILAGGLSPERDVSIRSGRRVAEALRATGIEVTECDVDANLIATIRDLKPDAIVPLLHGATGEDGAVRHVLATLGVPFVGASGSACALAFDKSVASTLVARAGIAVPRSVALPQTIFRELGATAVLDPVVADIGLPLVVKPTKGGSALGVTIVHEQAELPAAMVSAFAYGDTVLLQQFISGTELALSVLDIAEPQALPAVEIAAPHGFYDYHARYVAGTTEFFAPARVSDAVAALSAEVALLVHTTLGLRDWSRTDVIVDDTGTLWFLEVNVAPGMTETSLFPQSLAAAGRDLGSTVAALVQQAITR